jgi:hypothetical protein
MNMHDLMPYIFIVIFLAFVIWSVIRGRRWEKYQAEAARRAKTIMEAASSDRERFAEVMSVSREHLEVTKELLSEIKALRNDLTGNQGQSA